MATTLINRLVQVNGKWLGVYGHGEAVGRLCVGDVIGSSERRQQHMVVASVRLHISFPGDPLDVDQSVYMKPELGYEGDAEMIFPYPWDIDEVTDNDVANWPKG
jgi:hypothetical protein